VSWKTIVACGIAALAGTGCLATRIAPVTTDAPASFDHGAGGAIPVWPGEDWYSGFASNQLNALITLAVRNNTDLRAAAARIAQAEARARQAGAAILPNLDAAGAANFLAGHSSYGSAHEIDWSALFTASYEVDFWGKNRAKVNAAGFTAAASRADRDTLALTALAAVADGYFEVLALHERETIARSNRDTARALRDAVQSRFDAGAASPVELAIQTAALGNAAAAIPELERREAESRAALAILVGQAPEQFAIEYRALAGLSEPAIVAGLPAELLRRRPDVFAAESNLRAAHADLDAARAALFPSLNLTAAAGLQNPAVNAAVITLPGSGPTLALTASLVQTIFDHGKLQAQRAEVLARNEELLAAYRGAILDALRDTETALSTIQYLDTARPFQIDALAEEERAFEGAKLRYEAGAGDYLSVLESQRSWYAARDQFVQYQLARLQARVALCKALGGGWQHAPPALRTTRNFQP
jgi:NodT family efflux transporter outer membrane factor (OMF) lipoprotein